MSLPTPPVMVSLPAPPSTLVFWVVRTASVSSVPAAVVSASSIAHLEDLLAEQWTIYLDGTEKRSGPINTQGELRTIRLHMDGDYANDAAAVDNFRVYGSSAPGCPGDVDGDGDTDLADLSFLLAAYGTTVGDPDYNPDADFEPDGDVDLADLSFLLADYNCGK